MAASTTAITCWLGALSRPGALDEREREGMLAAVAVVGEQPLYELRQWLSVQPEHALVREKCGAIDVLIWLAQADLRIEAEERRFLGEVIDQSGLPADTRAFLRSRLHQMPDVSGVAQRVTHPVLRRLVLALAWDLAQSDGRVDPAESHGYYQVAEWLGLERRTADRIARTMQRQ